MSPAPGWQVEELRASAADVHARALSEADGARAVWIAHPVDRAVVLGSAQSDDIVDRARARSRGLEVVRRRSGGGAVLIEPGDVVWIDVIVPTSDPLWVSDVGRSFAWLGATWQRALAGLGRTTDMHEGAMTRTPASEHVCFAGLGPGELTQRDKKVVGLSQRRTRGAARFQCAAVLRWNPEALIDVFHDVDQRGFALEVSQCATGLELPADDVIAAFLSELP